MAAQKCLCTIHSAWRLSVKINGLNLSHGEHVVCNGIEKNIASSLCVAIYGYSLNCIAVFQLTDLMEFIYSAYSDSPPASENI